VASLRKNGLVDDSTITAIRRQYQHVLSLASDEARADADNAIGVRLVFERLDAEGLVGERVADVPPGTMQGSVRLVKRGADDRGYDEWREHHWTKRIAEAQAKAEEDKKAATERSPFFSSRGADSAPAGAYEQL